MSAQQSKQRNWGEHVILHLTEKKLFILSLMEQRKLQPKQKTTEHVQILHDIL